MIKVLDLDQPQQVGIVDVERRFSKQERSKISLILELLAELGVEGVYRISSQEVVRAERERSLGVGNPEVLPLPEILGNVTVEDEEEGEQPQQNLKQHLGEISQPDCYAVLSVCGTEGTGTLW